MVSYSVMKADNMTMKKAVKTGGSTVYLSYTKSGRSGKEVFYVSYFYGGKADHHTYADMPGSEYFFTDFPGDALPEYDQRDRQYGYHRQSAAETMQAEICQLL